MEGAATGHSIRYGTDPGMPGEAGIPGIPHHGDGTVIPGSAGTGEDGTGDGDGVPTTHGILHRGDGDGTVHTAGQHTTIVPICTTTAMSVPDGVETAPDSATTIWHIAPLSLRDPAVTAAQQEVGAHTIVPE